MYFLTLVVDRKLWDTGRPRCIGFKHEPFQPSCLSHHDTEEGYYTYAVVEFYNPGLWVYGKDVAWWQFKEGVWQVCEKPEWTKHISNWAF